MLLRGKIAIFIASILFFIHAFIPHSHNNITNQPVVSAASETVSLFGFLSFVVDFDLGENHLTSFFDDAPELEKEIVDNLSQILFFNPTTFFQFYLSQNHNKYLVASTSSHIYLAYTTSNFFRGPPDVFNLKKTNFF